MSCVRSLAVLSLFSTAECFGIQQGLSVRSPAVAATPIEMALIEKLKLPAPSKPRSAKAAWEVHKFGGASLATADLYKECSDLLVSESRRELDNGGGCIPTMAIVSAKGGVTDKLIAVVNAALTSMTDAEEKLMAVAEQQIEVVNELAGPEVAGEIANKIREDEKDILNVIRAVGLLKTIPGSTMELVTGYGEVWSAMTMYSYLQEQGVATAWLDARDVLVVEQTGFGLGEKGSSNVVGTDPIWDLTATRVQEWFADPARSNVLSSDCSKAAPVVVVTGFVAATLEGTPTTLKRSGSDYSATIFARLMEASRITMWKNVNGVYTADPRRVPVSSVEQRSPPPIPPSPHPHHPHSPLTLTPSHPLPHTITGGLPHREPQIRRGDRARLLWRSGPPSIRNAAMHRGRDPYLRPQRLQPGASRHRHPGPCMQLRGGDDLVEAGPSEHDGHLAQGRMPGAIEAGRAAHPRHHVRRQCRYPQRRGHWLLCRARPRGAVLLDS